MAIAYRDNDTLDPRHRPEHAAQARSKEEIEREFMNWNKPHDEGHWWAMNEIVRLREENAKLRMDHIAAHRINVSTITWLEKLLADAKHPILEK